LTRKQLINDQQADHELQTIAQHAGQECDVSNSPVYSLLYEYWSVNEEVKSSTVPASDEWETVYQICSGTTKLLCRKMRLAHFTPFGWTPGCKQDLWQNSISFLLAWNQE